jgi:hypothetical protein
MAFLFHVNTYVWGSRTAISLTGLMLLMIYLLSLINLMTVHSLRK